MKELLGIYNCMKSAEEAYHSAIMRSFPKGSRFVWYHGNHKQQGEVTMHSVFGDRVQVLNHKTGKHVWVGIASVLWDYKTGKDLS